MHGYTEFDLVRQERDSSGDSGHFSDETTTGESNSELRGEKRISIAARLNADENRFEWVNRLYEDYSELLPSGEVKSMDVLRLCDAKPRAMEFVIRNICGADIFVIDLFQDYFSTLEEIRKFAPDPKHPIQSIAAKLRTDVEDVKGFLASERRMTVLNSIVPLIDDLRSEASQYGIEQQPLIDLERIGELSDQELRELIVRFTVLFSDAVNPEVRARVIAQNIAARCFLDRSHFAFEVLQTTTKYDMTFDIGRQRTIAELQVADGRLQEELHRLREQSLACRRRTIKQANSAEVLGIRAADIAAGFARRQFESNFEGDARSAARKLKEEFGRVMFNNRWL